MYNQNLLSRFEIYLATERRVSSNTVIAYKTDLMQFVHFLSRITSQKTLTAATMHDVRDWIMSLVKEALNTCSINRKMAALRTFYTFLQKKELMVDRPTDGLKSLKVKKRLPIFFQEKELLSFLNQYVFPVNFSGFRDKLILEMLYGTGIRLNELLSLQITDINLINRTIKVLGKRNKERLIPFLQPLKQMIEAYLSQKEALGYSSIKELFITDRGRPCYPMLIYRIVKKHLATSIQAGRYSPHIFRHTFATHLLNNGASLLSIKYLLGHSSLMATQHYTHVDVTRLKKVFKNAHPRA